MHALTVATDHEGFLHSLRASAKLFNYELHVLGLGQPWGGFVWRWKLLRDALRTLPAHEPVVVLDGYDTIFTAPAALLLDEFRKHPAPAVFAGVEHRREHCTWLFWKLTQLFSLLYYGTQPPLTNAGVLLGRAGALMPLCATILEQAEVSGERDDQRILNSLIAHDGRRGVDTLVVDRGVTASIVLHKLSGFHSHCDRSLFGPLRHLFHNVPHVPPGPLNYDAANGDFAEWLQTTNQPLKVRSERGLLDRVYVCHGIFSTHLGPICDALGIERPPPSDLAKRKISQADLRLFVETSRRLVRATAVLVAAYAAAVVLLRATLFLARAAYSAMAAASGF
jgi:hypothetical protein